MKKLNHQQQIPSKKKNTVSIKNESGTRFLLRISDGQSLERESAYYSALRKLNGKDLLISKLLDSGLCNNGKNTYRLFTWIEGTELIKTIDGLTEKEKYDYGYRSGLMLKEIHQVESPLNRLSWDQYYNQKIEKKLASYRNCSRKFKHSDRVIQHIESKRPLLKGRHQSFHHGDFHIGNMLITPGKELAVIDFDRLDFGDPWEEFNRITWSASKSPSFARGQINGYFEDQVPSNFFDLMSLYISVNMIGSLPWAMNYGEQEVNVILNQIEEVLGWYGHFRSSVPFWY